jgi:hypothetical protein
VTSQPPAGNKTQRATCKVRRQQHGSAPFLLAGSDGCRSLPAVVVQVGCGQRRRAGVEGSAHTLAGASTEAPHPLPTDEHQPHISAAEELSVLHRSGLHVTWPRAEKLAIRLREKPPPAAACPQPADGRAGAAAQSKEAQSEEEMEAALQELHELCHSGLRVRWPG